MSEQLKKAVRDRDLTWAFSSGIAAAIIMSYVTSVAKPSIIHLVLALIAVCAIVGAYLFIARSKIDAAGMTATVIATALVGVLCLFGLSNLWPGERQTPTFAIGSAPTARSFDYILGGIVVAGLLIYLVYALLRPERF